MRKLSIRRHAGKSADFDFVESYYRMMMSDGGHAVTVRTQRQSSAPDGTGDDSVMVTAPSSHVLYAERRTRYLSYACKVSGGDYATKYARTSYSLSNSERIYKTEYCFMQDGQRMQLFQTLNGTASTGTLLFESEMPYTMVPTMMIEHDSRVILCMNALHSYTNEVPDDDDNEHDANLPIHTGYIYVISIDMLDGQWHPLFESDRQIRYSVHGVTGKDGKIGILIANICDDRRGPLPIPRAFKDIPKYVMEESPHEGPSMNVPYGISVYSPESSNFTLIPIGGNEEWGIAGINITEENGSGLAARADDEQTGGRNVLRVIACEDNNDVPEHGICTHRDETLDS